MRAERTGWGGHAPGGVAPGAARRRPWGRSSAFTLIELLLVVAIITIGTMVSFPYLVRSIRGNRLRTAVRSIVMAGRYARSMALLDQQPMVLTFDLGVPTLSVAPLRALPSAAPPPEGAQPPPVEPTQPPAAVPALARNPRTTLTRVLDGVRIESVETPDTEEEEGPPTVVYRSNGRCTPYKVRVVDSDGATVLITVDALSTAETTRER